MSDSKTAAAQILAEWQQADRALTDGFSKSFWAGVAPVESRVTLAEIRYNNAAIALTKVLQILAGEPEDKPQAAPPA